MSFYWLTVEGRSQICRRRSAPEILLGLLGLYMELTWRRLQYASMELVRLGPLNFPWTWGFYLSMRRAGALRGAAHRWPLRSSWSSLGLPWARALWALSRRWRPGSCARSLVPLVPPLDVLLVAHVPKILLFFAPLLLTLRSRLLFFSLAVRARRGASSPLPSMFSPSLVRMMAVHSWRRAPLWRRQASMWRWKMVPGWSDPTALKVRVARGHCTNARNHA
mmetsp:Transcript_67839/g.147719  ORF Transcript_67839/g.147719 Transcript_67839/m.147719 type:complete len:221 (+) Transcript_67839:428-1090(+)